MQANGCTYVWHRREPPWIDCREPLLQPNQQRVTRLITAVMRSMKIRCWRGFIEQDVHRFLLSARLIFPRQMPTACLDLIHSSVNLAAAGWLFVLDKRMQDIMLL